MLRRHMRWWLTAGALVLLLLAFNLLSFRAAQSTTEVNHSLSVARAGESLPESMTPGFTLAFTVTGEGSLATALEAALPEELEALPSVGTATAVSASAEVEPAPFLMVELSPERLWTPVYGQATVEAQIYYAYDGDAPWPLDEAIVFETSPAVKADGSFTVVDTTWGVISKPAYSKYLAQELAEAMAAALQAQVFTIP